MARNKTTLRGKAAGLTKGSLDGPARTPSRLRDSQSRSSPAPAAARRLAARRGAGLRRFGRNRRRHGFAGRPTQGCFQPLRHLGEILVGAGLGRRRRRRRRGRRRCRGPFGRARRRLRRFGTRRPRHHRLAARGDPRRHRLGPQLGAGLGPATHRFRREAGQRIDRSSRSMRSARSGRRSGIGSAAPGGALRRQRRDAPAAAAARAFAARHGRTCRSAAPSPSLQPASGSGAIRGGGSAPPTAGRCAQLAPVREWRARYWVPRRCRSGRRSSADARCCRAAPAPAGGGRRPRRRRSPPAAASARDWCWRRGGWWRIGEPARRRGRSAPERPRTRRRM